MDLERGCPESSRWLAYLEGTLPDAEQEALVAHLGNCRTCQEELHRHSAPTGLFEGMKPRVDPGQSPGDPVLARALSQLKAEASTTPNDPASPRPPGDETSGGDRLPDTDPFGEGQAMAGESDRNNSPWRSRTTKASI